MNIKEYISSGIIECYVLGLASSEEAHEFEQLCNIYPELVAERDRFEHELEEHTFASSVPAPAHIGKRVLNIISTQVTSPEETIAFSQPKRIFLSNKTIRYLAAACVIALLGLGYLFYSLQAQNRSLININTQLQAKNNSSDSTLSSIVNAKKILKNNNLSLVEMKSGAGDATANIYWDSTSSAVYMIVRSLPPLPQDKQYQLWAFIDGKIKDLGVFDATSDNVILKMKNCKKAEAFSITVEPRGGNTAPSTHKIEITGKTKSL